MSTHRIKDNVVPLKAYLRADSYSQHFIIDNDNTKIDEFVTNEMFWGNKSKDGLYLHYKNIDGRQILVCNGINGNESMHELNNEDCDDWLDRNLLNIESDNTIVIQGYAGSGKTTLMNYIKNKLTSTETCYIDICQNWKHEQEAYLFFNKSLSILGGYLDKIFSEKRGIRNKIWKKFIDLISSNSAMEFDVELNSLADAFENLQKTNNWNTLRRKICTYLNENYSEKLEKSKRPNNVNWHSRGQTQLIISLIVLLFAAMQIENYVENKKMLIIFDNLDIISNPAIPSENIISLWGIIDNYQTFKKDYSKYSNQQLPLIGIQISVRKVLYSHISSHLPDLEMNLNYDNDLIKVCDMSNLYSSQEILKHRISYWLSNELLDNDTREKLEQLSQISDIHTKDSVIFNDCNYDDELNIINLDAFFNHNYRAFVNALSDLFKKNEYSNYISKDLNKASTSQNWQKISTLIFSLVLLYRNNDVWNSLGFGCNYFDLSDFPTTLNRLLLNCLYYSRYGCYLSTFPSEKNNLPTDEFLSLDVLVEKFSKNIFIKAKTGSEVKQAKKMYLESKNTTERLIIERLADMCARNPSAISGDAVGYNSEDDELWRRPIFFIGGIKLEHTAISRNELINDFEKYISNDEGKKIKFVITDEGMILIRDIVANFEFYSARYCSDELVKPLHHVKTKDEVINLIQPVYNAIVKCIDKHTLFMDDYISNYMIDINQYLTESFHARTNPKFECKTNKVSSLKGNSFRPQLHIVRVIYSHISYFNYVKNAIYNSSLEEKNDICVELTTWIENYLDLYKKNFFDIFKDSICDSDNTVYKRLKKLTNKQKKHYETDMKNINISLKKNSNKIS